ncbi:hypothetical protein VSX64_01245 [Aurantimonas sp. C2-6-R+9]|uniref:hypothetical protein n=1 Tax=unclassified Aurantimonas TaxID=2638230 RepID=UPI002E19D8D2|nr:MULTISPECIES: hypothetical protein [unclassified Aurantimonas]MEC5289550.1 hypothetical protein [Aurantimonas sp. C2-3-R2]MEC5379515.1 hypothetical protein [Aurantimonas sp. C2-6-R+9]MEC5410631.1 hypothetical protein [Aurantimonas sp. C2-4-R8]
MKNILAISVAVAALAGVLPAAAQSLVPGSDFYIQQQQEAQRQSVVDGSVSLAPSASGNARAFGYVSERSAPSVDARSVIVPGSDFELRQADEFERRQVRR